MDKSINNIGNYYEIKENIAYISVLKKNGTELTTMIDAKDLEKVTSMGTWFAEWNKYYNNYIVQNISTTKKNKKAKPLKQSMQSVILNVNPKAPIRYINGDTLDNRKANLEIFNQNTPNDYKINEGVVTFPSSIPSKIIRIVSPTFASSGTINVNFSVSAPSNTILSTISSCANSRFILI